ncbi:hypothetical protein [Streptomyces chattanoogensis]|uniref:Uncharacterized protein n=1 Tax=Streptomyces chattanoogensis TaxID=66876 RepID=A0A0N1JXG2_9ACTN|nr:hypothetical protein [Streptomyces chattanoogensis]KPC61535.1 hypothetical protein ADL29_23870 [Streptomyces chattanoogensis]
MAKAEPATAPHDGGYPLHTVPYQPTLTLPQGPALPAFRTKGQLSAPMVARVRAATPNAAAVEPNSPLMTETGKTHTPSQTTVRSGHALPRHWTPVDVTFGFC